MIESNRELLEDQIYKSDGTAIGRDMYALFRKNGEQTELICGFTDIILADNYKHELQKQNPGWEYFLIDSDLIW